MNANNGEIKVNLQPRGVDSIVALIGANVVDDGPTLSQQCVNDYCLLGPHDQVTLYHAGQQNVICKMSHSTVNHKIKLYRGLHILLSSQTVDQHHTNNVVKYYLMIFIHASDNYICQLSNT